MHPTQKGPDWRVGFPEEAPGKEPTHFLIYQCLALKEVAPPPGYMV